MKYFAFLNQSQQEQLFTLPPTAFSRRSPRQTLRRAVGTLLYVPATHTRIAEKLILGEIPGATSVAICLEDAVGEEQLDFCLNNSRKQLHLLRQAVSNGTLPVDRLPLLFIRVRHVEMLRQLAPLLGDFSSLLTGIILPKVTLDNLEPYLTQLMRINQQLKQPLYAMPTLETEALLTGSRRLQQLEEMRAIFDAHQELILNLRIGATDLCGLYGVRRDPRTPIYQVGVIAHCIADIVQIFGLHDRYTISAPVWEYYASAAGTPSSSGWQELAGLLAEVQLDLANGLLGKTCIHPSQLLPIQAAHVVPYEVYQDALSISRSDGQQQGVCASPAHNKMNEIKPHALWAAKICAQAQVYGVSQPGLDGRQLLRVLTDCENAEAPSAILADGIR